jgi:antitoxin VapB
MQIAKVFWSGGSQAVRLPKRFRLKSQEVGISKRGNEIILKPLPDTWAWLDEIARPLDPDFVEAVQEQPQTTHRPALAKSARRK